jgi:hypothetical protein
MYGLACHLEQWVVCEEKDYLQQTDRYKQIESHGSRIIVVPGKLFHVKQHAIQGQGSPIHIGANEE